MGDGQANRGARETTGAAILQVMLSALLFSFSGLTSKWMPWGGMSQAGARALVAALVLAGVRGGFKVRLTPANLLASVSVMLTSVLFLCANKLTTAANAIVLQYAMPAIVLFLCAVIYRQKPTRREIVTALLVLAGVALCFLDSLGGGHLSGDALAILSAFTYSVVFFAARLPGCDPRDYTYLGNLMSAALIAFMPFDPSVWRDGPMPWLVAALMGLLLAGGYAFFARGIRGVSPVTAALVSNIEPVLNPVWVFLALGEKPGVTAVAGAVLVLATITVYSVMQARGRASANASSTSNT